MTSDAYPRRNWVAAPEESLCGVDFPAAATGSERAAIARASCCRRYDRHQEVTLPQGSELSALAVACGSLGVYREFGKARRLLLGELPADQPWLTSGGPRAVTAEYLETTADGTAVLCLPVAALRQLARLNGEVACHLIDLLERQLTGFYERLEELALHPLLGQVARELLREAKRPSMPDAAGASGAPIAHVAHFTHERLADRIGAYREDVTKALHKLETMGLIRIEPARHQIWILDGEGLAEL